MAIHYRTLGFVLGKNDRGESDQLLTIYTKEYGKIEILGKAIRKIKSKLRSSVDIFYLSEIEFIQGKAYKTLTDSMLVNRFQNIKDDLAKLAIAGKIAKTLDRLVIGQERDEKTWDLLKEVFNKLNTLKSGPAECGSESDIIYYYFVWNLLSILGYRVDLYHCAVCRKKLLPTKLFYLAERGIIDPGCFARIRKGKEVSPEVVKIIRLFLERNQKVLSRLKIKEEHIKSLDDISDNYPAYYKEAG